MIGNTHLIFNDDSAYMREEIGGLVLRKVRPEIHVKFMSENNAVGTLWYI
jgi:hypothetical protein